MPPQGLGDAGPPPEARSGAELARETRLRTRRAGLASNGVGARVVFLFGFLAPLSPAAGDWAELAILNSAAFVAFGAAAMPAGMALARRASEPLGRWLREERPATGGERELALRYPLALVRISATIWAAAAVVFTAVNATYSLELAVEAGVVAGLGGATTCAVGYLLAERIARPVVARALAGGPPPRPTAPGVAARLTMAWTLATGVPVLGCGTPA